MKDRYVCEVGLFACGTAPWRNSKFKVEHSNEGLIAQGLAAVFALHFVGGPVTRTRETG